MTDEKFLLKFLNKNYTVVLEDIEVKVKEKDTTKSFSFDYFIVHRFNLIIGRYRINDELISTDIVVQWFKDKKIELTKHLFDYLSNTLANNINLKLETLTNNKSKFIEDLIKNYK